MFFPHPAQQRELPTQNFVPLLVVSIGRAEETGGPAREDITAMLGRPDPWSAAARTPRHHSLALVRHGPVVELVHDHFLDALQCVFKLGLVGLAPERMLRDFVRDRLRVAAGARTRRAPASA